MLTVPATLQKKHHGWKVGQIRNFGPDIKVIVPIISNYQLINFSIYVYLKI